MNKEEASLAPAAHVHESFVDISATYSIFCYSTSLKLMWEASNFIGIHVNEQVKTEK